MQMTRDRVAMYLKWALRALIAATVLFILIQSCLPPEVSSAESEAVGGWVTSFIPEDTKLFDFVTEYMRKIAHFTEYGLLGIEVVLYIAFFTKERKKWVKRSPLVPLTVGFIDETVQKFSKRGPMIEDVWIDIGGFITFSLLAWGVLLLTYSVTKLIKNKKTEDKQNG